MIEGIVARWWTSNHKLRIINVVCGSWFFEILVTGSFLVSKEKEEKQVRRRREKERDHRFHSAGYSDTFPRSSLLKPVSIRKQNRNWLQLKVYCHCQKNHKARLGKKVKIPIAWNESMHPWHAEQTMDAYILLERKQTPKWYIYFF